MVEKLEVHHQVGRMRGGRKWHTKGRSRGRRKAWRSKRRAKK